MKPELIHCESNPLPWSKTTPKLNRHTVQVRLDNGDIVGIDLDEKWIGGVRNYTVNGPWLMQSDTMDPPPQEYVDTFHESPENNVVGGL